MRANVTIQIIEDEGKFEIHLNVPDNTPQCIATIVGQTMLEFGQSLLNQATGQGAEIQSYSQH